MGAFIHAAQASLGEASLPGLSELSRKVGAPVSGFIPVAADCRMSVDAIRRGARSTPAAVREEARRTASTLMRQSAAAGINPNAGAPTFLDKLAELKERLSRLLRASSLWQREARRLASVS